LGQEREKGVWICVFQDLEERDSISAERNEPVGFWWVGAVVKIFA